MDRTQGQLPGQRNPSGELVGPYELRIELARGELTTVHLAQREGALGFQRLFALKRLKPAFARQPDQVELLVDEARLTASLRHPNVVGVHDVGRDGGCFVVMDYVDGENFENLLARIGRERHPRFVAPIVVDLLNGLHAVHTARGEDGVPMGLVHQAPSARHVMVGTDGTSRLIDFSQARASGQAPSHARSDRLRVASMAPEQALDPTVVDFRADLFIVGILLWESLTGERLFAADSEAVAFQNVLHKRIPRPSEVGLRPPRCFDQLVMRALERDAGMRHASAHDMARELRDVAINQALYATPGEVGQWVTALAGRQLDERRRRIIEEGQQSGSGMFSSGARDGRVEADDFDKTPAFGVRAAFGGGQADSLRPARIQEVDGRRGRDDRSSMPAPPPGQAADLLTLTPSGARMAPSVREPEHARDDSRRPLWETDATITPRSTRGQEIPQDLPYPFRQYDDAESTNPAGFVPARPGARRTPGQQSPGSYSEVKARKRPSGGENIFEEVDTSRLDLRSPSSTPPGPRSVPFEAENLLRGTTRAPSDPPRQKAVTESPSPMGGRRDSTPQRLTLPDGPVGQPLSVPAPKPAAAFALPEEPTTLDRMARQRMLTDTIKLPPADSLSPPQTAARTAPPAQLVAPARPRGLGFWVSAGMLLGIIAVAGVVGVRNWSAQQTAAAPDAMVVHAGSASMPAPAVEEPAPAADVAPAGEVAPAAGSAAPSQPLAAPAPVAAPTAAASTVAAPAPAKSAAPEPKATLVLDPVALRQEPTTTAEPIRPPSRSRRRAAKAQAPSAASLIEPPAADVAPVSAEIRERLPPARSLPANPY